MYYDDLLSVLIQLDEEDRSVIVEAMDSDVVDDMFMELLEEVELEESMAVANSRNRRHIKEARKNAERYPSPTQTWKEFGEMGKSAGRSIAKRLKKGMETTGNARRSQPGPTQTWKEFGEMGKSAGRSIAKRSKKGMETTGNARRSQPGPTQTRKEFESSAKKVATDVLSQYTKSMGRLYQAPRKQGSAKGAATPATRTHSSAKTPTTSRKKLGDAHKKTIMHQSLERGAKGAAVGAGIGAGAAAIYWAIQRLKLKKKLSACTTDSCRDAVRDEIKDLRKKMIKKGIVSAGTGAALGGGARAGSYYYKTIKPPKKK